MANSVLIVDDNEHLRKILSSILQFSGYEIVEAESGAEAIEKAASDRPHLILLDLVLSDMTGIDVARSIKRNKRSAHIPIIAFSAYLAEEEKEAAFRAGCVDYFQKPIPAAEIKARIAKYFPPFHKNH